MKKLIVLLVAISLLSSCGKDPCPLAPTNCGPLDRYGNACQTYQEYFEQGYDVRGDRNRCFCNGPYWLRPQFCFYFR
jgi:hypothetical protein